MRPRISRWSYATLVAFDRRLRAGYSPVSYVGHMTGDRGFRAGGTSPWGRVTADFALVACWGVWPRIWCWWHALLGHVTAHFVLPGG